MKPDLEGIMAEIKGIVGESHLLTDPAKIAPFKIDGNLPKGIVFPSNKEEISRTVRLATSKNFSIIPWGGGTKIDIGNIPKKLDLILSLKRLDKIVEHDPLNLIVTVEAGTSLAKAQNHLSKDRQFIALDPPFSKEATIGGIISTNSSGPKRYLYGTCRDFMLGLEIVLSNGDIVKTGGKTVKNVTGYDMNKLFIGSFGTLGIITQATFKVLPLPEDEKIIILSFTNLKDLISLIKDILKSVLVLSSLEILNPLASNIIINNQREITLHEGTYNLVIGVEGAREAVKREISDIIVMGEEKGISQFHVLQGDEMKKLIKSFSNLTTIVHSQYSDFIKCKASILISKVYDMIQISEGLAEKYNLECGITSHGGSGIVYIYFLTKSSNGNLKDIIFELSEETKKLEGSLVVERAPSELKKEIDVWGNPEDSFEIMRNLKNQFDSKGLLNPGRFLRGL